jgi:hypothetical protein
VHIWANVSVAILSAWAYQWNSSLREEHLHASVHTRTSKEELIYRGASSATNGLPAVEVGLRVGERDTDGDEHLMCAFLRAFEVFVWRTPENTVPPVEALRSGGCLCEYSVECLCCHLLLAGPNFEAGLLSTVRREAGLLLKCAATNGVG